MNISIFWNVLNFNNIHIPDKERSACRSEARGVWAIRALHSKNLINTSANSRWETFIVISFIGLQLSRQSNWNVRLVSCRLLPINRFGTVSANSQSECLQRSSKCSKLSVWVSASNLGFLKLSVCLKLTMQMLETLGVLSVWNLRCKFLKWNLFQVNCDGSEQEVIKKKKDLREKGKRSIQPVHRRKPKVH